MKQILALALLLFILDPSLYSQKSAPKPVEIFSSTKAINARTTEVTGKGKLDFNVTHNFGDLGGSNGGIKRFFGLDNSSDVRIAFTVGVTSHFDLGLARAKGAGPQQQLYELSGKYQFMQQRENDPSHPLAITLFANTVIAANTASSFANQENSYKDFSDRMSNVLQLILAKKIGSASIQLNPTLVTRGYAISYDQKSIFAMGGAFRIPLTAKINLVIDYFHPFRNQSSKDSFRVNNNIKFYDPLGIGFEFITAGHVFRMNFTNATEILENRFIPRTISSWGKGQFRWGFNISRKFTLWR
jgi:hypothetical protein